MTEIARNKLGWLHEEILGWIFEATSLC